jgi:hypothetical protein
MIAKSPAWGELEWSFQMAYVIDHHQSIETLFFPVHAYALSLAKADEVK